MRSWKRQKWSKRRSAPGRRISVILNKFAKAEEEGGGMRDAIAASVSAGIPVFMGVGTPAIPALQQFAGALVTLIDADEAVVAAWLSAHFGEQTGRFSPSGKLVA